MPVLREDTDTFLMFHKRARPSLDNRLTALLNYKLIKVPFLPVNYMYIILYIRDSIQALWLLGTNIFIILICRITYIGKRANSPYTALLTVL